MISESEWVEPGLSSQWQLGLNAQLSQDILKGCVEFEFFFFFFFLAFLLFFGPLPRLCGVQVPGVDWG